MRVQARLEAEGNCADATDARREIDSACADMMESMLAQEAPGEGQGGLGVRAAEEQTASIDRDTANAPDTDPESARGEESAVEETPKQDSQSALLNDSLCIQ